MSKEAHHFKSSVHPGDVPPYSPPPPYGAPLEHNAPQGLHEQYQQPYPYYYNDTSAYPPGTVVTQPPCDRRVTLIHQAPPARPPDYLVLAIIVTCCCNVLLGAIAIIFSALSSSDYREGNIEGARSKGKVSLGMSIAGVVMTVSIVAFAIIYVTVIATSSNRQCLYGLCYHY